MQNPTVPVFPRQSSFPPTLAGRSHSRILRAPSTLDRMARLHRLLGSIVVAIASAGIANAQSQIPTPESVLGFQVGADFKLATYDESIA